MAAPIVPTRPAVVRPGTLLRPSALSRFWGLHPKTVIDWIREGRLTGVRTPGAHFRVRAGDVRDFCARQSLPVPPFARTDVTRVVLAGVGAAGQRVVERALAGRSVALEAFASAVDGFVSVVRDPAAVVALDAASRQLEAEAAIRALRALPGLEEIVVIAFDVSSEGRAEALVRAGATRALVKNAKSKSAPLAKALGEVVP